MIHVVKTHVLATYLNKIFQMAHDTMHVTDRYNMPIKHTLSFMSSRLIKTGHQNNYLNIFLLIFPKT
jgi:hypothetical protein